MNLMINGLVRDRLVQDSMKHWYNRGSWNGPVEYDGLVR